MPATARWLGASSHSDFDEAAPGASRHLQSLTPQRTGLLSPRNSGVPRNSGLGLAAKTGCQPRDKHASDMDSDGKDNAALRSLTSGANTGWLALPGTPFSTENGSLSFTFWPPLVPASGSTRHFSPPLLHHG